LTDGILGSFFEPGNMVLTPMLIYLEPIRWFFVIKKMALIRQIYATGFQ
jgi:hypothetical protein